MQRGKCASSDYRTHRKENVTRKAQGEQEVISLCNNDAAEENNYDLNWSRLTAPRSSGANEEKTTPYQRSAGIVCRKTCASSNYPTSAIRKQNCNQMVRPIGEAHAKRPVANCQSRRTARVELLENHRFIDTLSQHTIKVPIK
uniref:Uncharacterized protein n=1 Tax=Steinernema glaseri TaxID=37863 RepID=A0A1I8A306_9BILA